MNNNTELQTFEFQSHQLTVITDEHGEPWFIAKEVAELLEYSDAHKMTSKLDEGEVQNRQIRGSGFNNKGTIIINESGLWSSVLRSTKAVKKWLTSEVLPTLRKTGHYGMGNLHPLLAPVSTPMTFEEFNQHRTALYAALSQLAESTLNAIPVLVSGAHFTAPKIAPPIAPRQQKQSASGHPVVWRNKLWTTEEEAKMIAYLNDGIHPEDIAALMGRKPYSVKSRICIMRNRGDLI